MSLRRVAESRLENQQGPLVTVVVPTYDVADYLPEFLESVTAQSYRNLEILVVNDGSPDDSAQIARQWGRRDSRIRVIDKVNGGLGAARNTGVAEAQGTYISFADPDDLLPPDAIEKMTTTLQRTGSEFVVGSSMRQRGTKRWMSKWMKSAHRQTRYGIRLADHPEVLSNVFAWNKMWRLDFFRRVVGGFPTSIAYEDQEPSLKSYLGASAFDVIPDAVYYWRTRDDGSSISQQKATVRDLTDRLSVTYACSSHIFEQTNEAVRAAWVRKIFAVDLIQYIERVPRTGPEYFETLSKGVGELVDSLETEDWLSVPIYPRLAALYAARSDEQGLLNVVAGRHERGLGYQLQEDDSGLYAIPGYISELANPPDRKFFRIDPKSLEMVTSLLSVEWLDGHRVRIAGTACTRSVFLGSDEIPILVELENTASGERHSIPSEKFVDPYANENSGTAWRDCSTSGFSAIIDTSTLPLVDDHEQDITWRLVMSSQIGSHLVRGVVQTCAADAGAGVLGFSSVVDGRRAALQFDDYDGLIIGRAKPRSVAQAAHIDGRRIHLVVESLTGSKVIRLQGNSRRSSQHFSARPTCYDVSGCAVFDVNIPAVPKRKRVPGRSSWNLEVLFADGSTGKIAAAESTTHFDKLSLKPQPLMWKPSGKGYLSILEMPFLFTCDEMSVDPETRELVFVGTILGDATSTVPRLEVGKDGTTLPARSVDWQRDDGRYRATFSLVREDWYGETVGLPSGSYALNWKLPNDDCQGDETAQRAAVPDARSRTLPWREDTDLNSIKMTRTVSGRYVWLRIGPPMTIEESGINARQKTISKATEQNEAEGLIEAVVFESFHGKQISDSVRALYDLLRERYPSLKLYWSVSSMAISVPKGSRAILQGSSEWLNIVHRARYLVNNANFPAYFRKQAGQHYLQTWHGTPMKKIAEDIPPENLSLGYRLLMRREVGYWDFLISQNPHSTKFLPSAFRYKGTVLETGYPRNDLLRSPNASTIKEQAKKRLGIGTARSIVLYAPTFRDNQTTGAGYAFDKALDFDELLKAAPNDTVFLVRGHSNTSGGKINVHDPRVIDVSTYGEISELFLISDMLITDYSSMMFDYVVTSKPIIFFVPDIEEYESSTRGFYLNFRDICPGPLSRTSAETATLICRAQRNPKEFVDDRYRSFVARFAPYDDGQASQRVLTELESDGWFSPSQRPFEPNGHGNAV